MFEYFVVVVEKILVLIEANESLLLAFSFANILSNWFIFKYHTEAIRDHKLFRDNIHILGRFCNTTYGMWRMLALAFAPCGIFVLCYSLYTRFDTIEFMRLYGIRNSVSSWKFIKSLPKTKQIVTPKKIKRSKKHKA